QKKRLELGRALAARPALLLADEVLAGLNPQEVSAVLAVFRSLRERGVPVIMIEHPIHAVMHSCDRLVVLVYGKQTAVGALPAGTGGVLFDGRDVTKLTQHEKAQLALVLVPEGRQLFSTMTILETVEMGATPTHARATMRETVDQVFALFPRLGERRTQL